MADEEQNLQLDETRLQKLGADLRRRLALAVNARRGLEDQWLKNVRQFVGLYDPEIIKDMHPQQSRAYPRITRVKVLSLVARLHALLFPAGEPNWSVGASKKPQLPSETLIDIAQKWMDDNPEARADQDTLDRLVNLTAMEIAKRMETVITDQLGDTAQDVAGDYQALVRRVLFSGAMYGPGVLKGPMTLESEGSVLRVDDNGMPVVSEVTLYRPYFEFVSLWDYFPDLSAKDPRQMDGEFQRHIYSYAAASKLAERADFLGERITKYLKEHPEGNYKKHTYETSLDDMTAEQSQDQPGEGKKYEFYEYWGYVTGHDLRAAGVEVEDNELSKVAKACVWMIDDVVVKAAPAPYGEVTQMYHQFVFEEDESSLLGRGLPQIMRDSQMGIATFTRMLVDNAGAVCGPSVEVDMEQLSSDTNVNQLGSWMVYKKDSASTNGQRAVLEVKHDAHINELLAAIKLMREFADEETFVSPMTGGDMENMPSEALRTQGNMSMAMGSAALPFKDIVRNFDQFTTSVIGALIQWNLVFHEDRERLQGDLRPKAKGATSLMAKEVRAYVLDSLRNTLTDEELIYINEEELLKERLSVRDLPLEKLLNSEEEVKRRKDERASAAQRQQAKDDEAFAAEMRTQNTEAVKDISQASKNMTAEDTNKAKLLLDAIEKGVDANAIAEIVGMARAAGNAGARSAPADQAAAGDVGAAGPGIQQSA